MRTAELELARQAETSYKRLVQDQQAGAPANKGEGGNEGLDSWHVHLLSRSPLTVAATCVNRVGAS
jgi:hypothetical protein